MSIYIYRERERYIAYLSLSLYIYIYISGGKPPISNDIAPARYRLGERGFRTVTVACVSGAGVYFASTGVTQAMQSRVVFAGSRPYFL